jgi:hypothetical protein
MRIFIEKHDNPQSATINTTDTRVKIKGKNQGEKSTAKIEGKNQGRKSSLKLPKIPSIDPSARFFFSLSN